MGIYVAKQCNAWDAEATLILGLFHLRVPKRNAQWKHGTRDFVTVTSGSLATVCNSRHSRLTIAHWKSATFLFRLSSLTVCGNEPFLK